MTHLWYLYQNSAEKIVKVIFVSENPKFTGIYSNIKQLIELTGLSDIIEVVTTDVSRPADCTGDGAISLAYFAPQGVDFTVLERHGFINSWQMGCNCQGN